MQGKANIGRERGMRNSEKTCSTSSSINSVVQNYHHIQFYVSNALQTSFWYCFHFGLERFAHRRSAHSSEIAVRKGPIIFLFKSAISPTDPEEIGKEIGVHGDFVKNVAYSVDNLDLVLECLNGNGHPLLEAKNVAGDEHGSMLIARISGSAGSIVHTLIQNIDYSGPFLPGFKPIQNFTFCDNLPPMTTFLGIDHVVEAHPEHSIENVTDWYQRILGMRRFWSIDDKLVHAEFSALRAILVGSGEGGEGGALSVMVTLVEPVQVNGSKRRGQVQDFLDFHGQSGVQHIAFLTNNIIEAVKMLRERGVNFLDIPNSYYDLLEKRLAQRGQNGGGQIDEDLAKIRELGILMDFDESGYLLQIFTKPVQDRATLFLEIIQRHNFNGFGAGNFKALFAAVEMEQKRREAEFGGRMS